jgi:hypothetical protein
MSPKRFLKSSLGLQLSLLFTVLITVAAPSHGHAREHALILDELRRLGIRKRVPFSSLRRNHPLNRIAGKLLATFGVR